MWEVSVTLGLFENLVYGLGIVLTKNPVEQDYYFIL
jgi:hypothetical protein